jgi:beta-glucosidase
MNKRSVLLLISILLLPAGGFPQTPPYKNPLLAIETRLQDLLGRMTPEEKILQMLNYHGMNKKSFDAAGAPVDSTDRYYLVRGVGFCGAGDADLTMREQAEINNTIQKFLRERSRLGIPAIDLSEGLHGFMARGATSFPQAIALASTWDTTLVEQVYAAAAREARARGSQQFLSPVIDLGREPRWGRFEETFGEDPWLVSRMGLAAVFGFQGRTLPIGKDHVAVTLKHFAGHGQPEGGRNTAPVNFSERIFRESHLFPFEIAVKVGHARSIMASYNEWDGVPNHINKKLLTEILRAEWGFTGYVMSDGGGIRMLQNTHAVAETEAAAGALALAAGIDMELDGFHACFHHLFDLVRQGVVPMAEIDRAAANILRVKFELGLFEDPYVDAARVDEITNSSAHKSLALKAAREAMILLKNDRNLLPFDSTQVKTLAVIGPNAADIHLGGYSAVPMQGTSVLAGLQQTAPRGMHVLYAEGCKIAINPRCDWLVDGNPIPNPLAADQHLIAEAVGTAARADAVLLVLGNNELTCREAWNETHLGDVDNLDLPGRQNELVKAVLGTGKPVVALLLNGRPLTINELAEKVPAIIEGWYLGQETGYAVADVLFGRVNPSGKLTVTFPRSVGQLPCYYNRRPTQNRSYAMTDNRPLFPFGHGLSYTTFVYKNMRVLPAVVPFSQPFAVEVEVSNTGKRAGDEIVQLYIRDKIGSLPRNIQDLRDFQRITLQPGETRTVRFVVPPEKLSFLDLHMHRVVEPGAFEIMVGKSSADYLSTELVVQSE